MPLRGKHKKERGAPEASQEQAKVGKNFKSFFGAFWIMAEALGDQKARFVSTWKCPICHELPVNPFQPACGHCLCYECALKLPVEDRKCPTCMAQIPSINKQPQLKELVEDHAALLWPDAQALIKSIKSMDAEEIQSAVAAFFAVASDEKLSSVRLLRISMRALQNEEDEEDEEERIDSVLLLAIFPILEVEKGVDGPGGWGGLATWMEHAITNDEVDLEEKTRFALHPAMRGVHEKFAPNLIPLFAEAADSECLPGELINAACSFIKRHIHAFPGGWEAFADIDGAALIAPPDAAGSAFQRSPTVKLLNLLSEALRDCERAGIGATRRVVADVSKGLSTVLAAGAASASMQFAVLRFADAVSITLKDDVVASELLLGPSGIVQQVLLGKSLPEQSAVGAPPQLPLIEAPHEGKVTAEGSKQLTGKRRRKLSSSCGYPMWGVRWGSGTHCHAPHLRLVDDLHCACLSLADCGYCSLR